MKVKARIALSVITFATTVTTGASIDLVPGVAAPAAQAVSLRITPATADSQAFKSCGTISTDGALATQFNDQLSESMANSMTAERVACARVIVATVRSMDLDERAARIAITTAIVEDTLLDGTAMVDHTSLGLYQQQDNWGTVAERTDPVQSTNLFFNAPGKGLFAHYPNNSWENGDVGVICQTVQVSAFPNYYDENTSDAEIIASTLWAMTTPQPPPPVTTSDGNSVSVNGTYHVVAVSAKGNVVQDTYSSGWLGWQDLGGTLIGTPAITYRSGEYDVFGVSSNGQLWQDTYHQGGSWSGWYADAGVLFSHATGVTAIFADGAYRVFGVGAASAVYEAYYTDAWHSTNLGGSLAGTPGATYAANGRYDVFATTTSGQLWQDTYQSGTWSGWHPDVTVIFARSAGVGAIYADGAYRIFGVGPGWAAYEAYFTDAWHSANLGGVLASTPGVTYASGRYDVFGLSSRGDLWQDTYRGSWEGWHYTAFAA